MQTDTRRRSYPHLLPMRERCEVVNRILRHRLDTVVPRVMRETGFDMWLIICNEDNHDPVFRTMLPMNTWTPVLQILVFFDRGGESGVERISISRTNTFDFYEKPYKVERPEQQWQWLREVVEARDPRRIAINQGEVIWAADGLSATLKDRLLEALPEEYTARLASGEDLCRRYLETLTEQEIELYPYVVSVSHAILKELYSPAVIVPGVTTLEDLRWAYWQRCADLGLQIAFTPSFVLVRRQQGSARDDNVIRRGDVVNCDVGINYLRLITDTKQPAYVLREGERDAPEGLIRLLADSNRLQDILCGEMVQGRSGNQILSAALSRARAEGLTNPRVYSHSCGLLLHEPGPLIGHPLEQEHWAGRGDVELNFDSSFTAELSVDGSVPEWDGQIVRLATEEQIIFTQKGVQFLDGRQTEFHLV